MEESEFGKGYSYCLGLFLMHAEREGYKDKLRYLWFNGAGDHIIDFEPHDERGNNFKSKMLDLRWKPEATEEDFEWAINEAKELLMEYDKRNGIEVIKGRWE